jgi:cytochrome c peroxidase
MVRVAVARAGSGAVFIVLAACGGQISSSTTASPAAGVVQSGGAAEVLSATPSLPSKPFAYSDFSAPLPVHFVRGGPGRGGPGQPFPPPQGFGPPPPPGGRGGPPGGPVAGTDNTPPDNRITDAGATLGRVLFYDRKLSANEKVSCGSCHQQQFGFSDTARFSVGLNGKTTNRHSMALANSRFYRSGRYFWDERAATLEAQVLQPIQNDVEMGMSLDQLVPRLRSTTYYPELFRAAFGTPDVSIDRISLALAQFVRSLVSAQSRFDRVFSADGPPAFGLLTPEEQDGQRIFNGRGQCATCHVTTAMVLDAPRNTGLDAEVTDVGAGRGRFKVPSLRNVAVRPPYMHDGRFATLEEVVDFYDHGVKSNRGLDPRLRTPDGTPRRLNLSAYEKSALISFLNTLTDSSFLRAEKFSDPFDVRR